MKNKRPLKSSILKYLQGTANSEELDCVNTFYDKISRDDNLTSELKELSLHEIESRVLLKIKAKQSIKTRSQLSLKKYLPWVAAVFLSLLFFGGYFWHSHLSLENDQPDVAPGKLSARLVLENGESYSLDSKVDLVHLEQKGIYFESDRLSIPMHEVITPKGGYFQLQLSDGSTVWLNAESSIRFPVQFKGEKREVFLKGEAYFDVSHNENAPFIVKSKFQSTVVYGTQFNICSYDGQRADLVTLIDGAVQVTSLQNESVFLKPGYQAEIGQKINSYKIDNAADVAAWRQGEFYFDETPFSEVMIMIGRWYNVEVSLENLPNNKLNGLVNRNVSLNKLLSLIEITTGVRIGIKNRELYVITNGNR